MGEPLRVLFVEDSQDDADLIIHEFKRGGFDITYERVETEEAMALALERKKWDLIICDYMMPRFNAMAALVVLKGSGLDIPAIVVSGTVGEEVAVETIRSGARDYILKDNLTRFIPSIKRELEQKEARKQDVQRQKQLKLLFELSHDFLCVFGFDGYFKMLNPSCNRVLGWTNAELMTKPFMEFVHPDDREETKSVFKGMQSGDVAIDFRNRYICKDSTFRLISWNSVSLPEQKAYFATGRDITDIKKAEEALLQSERRFREFFEETHLFSVILDAEGGVIFCNYSLLDKTGFKRDDVMNKPWFDVLLPEDERSRVRDMFFEKLKIGEIPAYFENDIITRQGQRLSVVWNNIILRDSGGNIIGTASIGEDITDRKKYEKDISTKIEEIERLNKFMTGRELRIIELKKEIDELLKEAGRPPRYKI